jgi:hypothetical protein
MVSKYKNIKCEFEGIKFDSQVERARYIDLVELYKRKEISYLAVQPKFLLTPAFERNGKKYRATYYIADFKYLEKCMIRGKMSEALVVEDVKGMMTDVYKLKRKKFLALNPHTKFREVRRINGKWEITEL